VRILGIETSCDETAAAVVNNGRRLLYNVVSSQVKLHSRHGGIVPELAARKHVEAINLIIEEALLQAGTDFEDLAAVAVTVGPGLPGALMVGIAAAVALGEVLKVPVYGINHLEGHIYAHFLERGQLRRGRCPQFPFVALIVSGGHTELVLCKNHGNYRILGGTRDDAAGEAFDKVARFLGLGYPGGPVIEKVAAGVKTKIKFPVPDAGRYDFSFSGLKTAVINWVYKNRPASAQIPEVAAAFQAAAVETLVRKTLSVLRDKKINTLLVGGGVAANKLLRETLEKLSREIKFDLFLPEITFCTDNAAMIAAAAYYRKKYVKKFLLLEVQPNLKIA